jgi:hypothetical protein
MSSIDTNVTGGFGYRIDPAECERLESVYGEPIEDLIKTDGAMGLPTGFRYSHYNIGYDEPCGLIIHVPDDNAAAALRGEIDLPDFSALIKWSKKHMVKFSREKPDLYFCTYTY